MAQFLFSYRVPKTPLREVLGELTEEQRASRIAAWNGWFDSMGASVLERGQPVGAAHEVGNCDGDLRVGGYSLVAAESLEQALNMAEGCPGVAWGGGAGGVSSGTHCFTDEGKRKSRGHGPAKLPALATINASGRTRLANAASASSLVTLATSDGNSSR